MNPDQSCELSASAWRQVDELCDRFESELRAGRHPQIEDFVPLVESPARKRLLRELILLEVEYRRIGGESPDYAEYRQRFDNDFDVVYAAFRSSLADTISQISSPGAESHAMRAFFDKVRRNERNDADDSNIGRTIGVYRLVERLGSGGMGSVYRATHTAITSTRAIKLLKPTLVEVPTAVTRFLLEAQAVITGVSHPNIVKTFDLLREEGEFYLVMELVDGCDLGRLIEKTGPIPIDDAVRTIEHVAAGLAYAHERGFVHRDIKPQNLILGADGNVKILDFGLVRALEESEMPADPKVTDGNAAVPGVPAPFRVSESKSIFGTLPYMSPEQLCDSRQADARSDIYSLGCTLYFLLTGRNAFNGTTPEKVLWAVTNREFYRPREIRSDIPAPLEDILLKCISPDPQSRFGSAKELARTLRAWRLQESIEGGQVPLESLTFETVDELGNILLKLGIVSENDWAAAVGGKGGDVWEPGLMATTIGESYQSAYLKSADSDRYSVIRTLDSLGLIYRSAGPGRGISPWQRDVITQGNAGLLRLPHHVLCEKIGFGWKGEVFVARHVDSNRLEALRTFSAAALSGLPGDEPERLVRFVEHVARIAAVQHRVLARVQRFDTCTTRAHPRLAYLSTEWIDGVDADEYMATLGEPSDRVRVVWVLRAIAEIARAVAVGHRQGILHLDLQSKCVRVLGNGDVILFDLGIAQMVTPRRLADSNPAAAVREDGQQNDDQDKIVGTPNMMPPEQWIDRANVSPATDVYYLGCLLCFWLTGESPYRGATLTKLLEDKLSDARWQPPGDIPVDVCPILTKMLAKQPEDRYQTMDELADDLDQVAIRLVSDNRRFANRLGQLWKWLRR